MPHTVRIRSAGAEFQQLEALRRNREKRRRLGLFMVEGVRPINQMLAGGWGVDALIYDSRRALSGWAQGVLRDAPARRHYVVEPELMAQLSGKSETSELLAVADVPPDDLGRIPAGPDLLAIVFDRPASPGNLGTLIRSADALRASGLVVTGHAADPYDPETVAASTGSLFALPTVRVPSPRDLEPWIAWLREQHPGLQIVGTDEGGDRDVDEQDWSRPTLLVLGNETWGMSAHFRERCDSVVRIPIAGSASSLNVACAASITLYEVDRQRRRAGRSPFTATRSL